MRPRNPGTSVTGSGKSRVTEKHQRYRGCNPVTCVTRALRVRASARASMGEREHGSQRSISPVCIYGVTRVTQVTYREKKAFRSNPIVTSMGLSAAQGYGNAVSGALEASNRAIAPRFRGYAAASRPIFSLRRFRSAVGGGSGAGPRLMATGGASRGGRRAHAPRSHDVPRERPRRLLDGSLWHRAARGRHGATWAVWRGGEVSSVRMGAEGVT